MPIAPWGGELSTSASRDPLITPCTARSLHKDECQFRSSWHNVPSALRAANLDRSWTAHWSSGVRLVVHKAKNMMTRIHHFDCCLCHHDALARHRSRLAGMTRGIRSVGQERQTAERLAHSAGQHAYMENRPPSMRTLRTVCVIGGRGRERPGQQQQRPIQARPWAIAT
jgi:hypothetical protein